MDEVAARVHVVEQRQEERASPVRAEAAGRAVSCTKNPNLNAIESVAIDTTDGRTIDVEIPHCALFLLDAQLLLLYYRSFPITYFDHDPE